MSETPITDPRLLEQLESGAVTDPALLAQLEGTEPQKPSGLDRLKSTHLSERLKDVRMPYFPPRQLGLTARYALEGGLMLPSPIADLVGLPRPENPQERVVGDVSRAMAGAGGLNALGRLMAGAAGPVVRGIGNVLTADPMMQTVSAGTAGLAGGTARESGASPMAQFVASLAGGMAPSLAVNAARVATSSPVSNYATPAQQNLNAAAEDAGFRLTASQRTGNTRLRTVEDTLARSPGGGIYQDIQRANQAALNRGAAASIGETAEALTPEVLANADARIGGEFNRLTNSLTVPLTQRFQNAVDSVRQNFSTVWNRSDAINEVLNNASAAANNALPLSGREYQAIRTALQRDSVARFRSGNPNEARALSQLIDALDDSAEAAMPRPARADFAVARRQWRNLVTLEDAMAGSQAGRSGIGDVSPAQLAAKTVANRGARQFARTPLGQDELVDLSRIGAGIRDIVPNIGSPTAERSYILNLLTGAGGSGIGAALGGPAGAAIGSAAGVGIPMAASRLLTAPWFQRYLENGVANIPRAPYAPATTQSANALLQLMRQ